MSAWPGKYVIGLTGNIATGKSVVRKMLEHLGAYGIDADALAHRAIAEDAPGYQPVVNLFGRWILTPDGKIDRTQTAKAGYLALRGVVREMPLPVALWTMNRLSHTSETTAPLRQAMVLSVAVRSRPTGFRLRGDGGIGSEPSSVK